MEWNLFIGRFHPLLVHLPIGMLILGYLFEIMHGIGMKKIIPGRKTIIATYIAGMVFGIIAALTGWYLSSSEDYGIRDLNLHKQLAIASLIVLLFVIVLQSFSKIKSGIKFICSTIAIILLSIAGHQGGNLTHGHHFLTEYAPSFLKQNDESHLSQFNSADSVFIFDAIIEPAIQDKCVSCHSKDHFKGGLVLSKYDQLFEEADNGIPIQKGEPFKSELFSRIILPKQNEKAMPPKGNGFSYTEIQVLKYWIENGADKNQMFEPDKMSPELIELVNKDYNLDYSPKPYYEKIKVDALPEEELKKIRDAGFHVSYLSEDNFLLDVAFNGSDFGDTQIEVLKGIADHITLLKLTNIEVNSDLHSVAIPTMPHLTRLDLSKSNFTESMLLPFTKSPQLISINLNETKVGTGLVDQWLKGSKVERIYLWKTNLSNDEISNLKKVYSETEIISGFQFEEVAEAKSVFEK